MIPMGVKCPRCGLIQLPRERCKECGQPLSKSTHKPHGEPEAVPRSGATRAPSPPQTSMDNTERVRATVAQPSKMHLVVAFVSVAVIAAGTALGLRVYQQHRIEKARVVLATPKAMLGDLSGDVFVLMKSGDVKRGADVEILLLPGTKNQEFAAKRREIAAPLWKLRLELEAGLQQARAAEKLAEDKEREARRRATEEQYATPPEDPKKWREHLDRIGQTYNDHESASQSVIKAHMAVSNGESLISQTEQDYKSRVAVIIAQMATNTVKTDVNGHFEIGDLPVGRHFLFARHRVFDNDLYWFVPVEVKNGSTKIDLSGSNEGWRFKLEEDARPPAEPGRTNL